MNTHIPFVPNYLLVISLLLAGTAASAQAANAPADQPEALTASVVFEENSHSFNLNGALQGPGGNHGGGRPGGPGGNHGGGGPAGNPGGSGAAGLGENSAGLNPGGPGGNPGGPNRRGPGQTNGVGLGGPGGNGPGGPGGSGHFGGLDGMGSAGIGGRGGGGGLSGIGPGGLPRPDRGSLGLGGGLGLGQGGPGSMGPGGGLGPGQNGPGGLGPGGLEPGAGLAGFLFGNGSFEIPAGPTISEHLDRGEAAQAAAQQAAGQGQAAVDQAVEAAQAAYEQVWEDYYAAVDYAAEAYYDTVTSAIDYGAETFEEYYDQAVADAQQAVNSYYDYYEDYLTYTALYPWDSYAYTYDEATGEYVTEETVNNYYYNYYYGETETTVTETIPVSATVSHAPAAPPISQAPAPSQEAYEAIVIFANDQLGAVVTPVYAGEVTQETLAMLANVPTQAQYPIYNAQNMAVTAYYGLLNGGVAALALGDCTGGGAACQLSGDIPADVSNVAVGTYSLQTAEVMPATPNDALELITLVYPKLTGLQFTQAADIPGYAFSATTTSVALQNGQPGYVAKVVFAGVINANGRTIVYATVGLGEAYANMVNPFQVTQ